MLPDTRKLNPNQRDVVYGGYVDAVRDVIGEFGKEAHFRVQRDLTRISEAIQADIDSPHTTRSKPNDCTLPVDSLRTLGAVAAIQTVLENRF